MDVVDLLARHRPEILRLAEAHGARNVRLFGSAARGEAGDESDIDVLVTMEPGRSLLDLVGLSQDLEQLLGRQVDVVSDRGLSPYLRDHILAEARAL
ncbi:MAG: nucleotidyltransferase family protein [Deltaproteobacteria bacterium]|nr:nucleotidyltransferase family protein [Deltaproteobacteria bacterium]